MTLEKEKKSGSKDLTSSSAQGNHSFSNIDVANKEGDNPKMHYKEGIEVWINEKEASKGTSLQAKSTMELIMFETIRIICSAGLTVAAKKLK